MWFKNTNIWINLRRNKKWALRWPISRLVPFQSFVTGQIWSTISFLNIDKTISCERSINVNVDDTGRAPLRAAFVWASIRHHFLIHAFVLSSYLHLLYSLLRRNITINHPWRLTNPGGSINLWQKTDFFLFLYIWCFLRHSQLPSILKCLNIVGHFIVCLTATTSQISSVFKFSRPGLISKTKLPPIWFDFGFEHWLFLFV